MPAVTICARYTECYISTYASCDNLCRVCGLLYYYLDASCDDMCRAPYTECYIPTYARLWRLVPDMQSVMFLPMLGCNNLCRVDCYISTYASCDDLCRLSECDICIYASCTGNAKFCFSTTVPGCDELCQICGLLHFYLCKLWRLVSGMWIIIFLPLPAAPDAPSFVFLPMPTVPGCDELCQICGLLYFYLCQLHRVRQVLLFYLFQLYRAMMTCAWYVDCYISIHTSCDDLCQANRGLHLTYASCARGASVAFLTIPTVPGCDDLCRVYGLLYFYLCQAVTTCAGYVDCYCQLWWPVPGIRSVRFLPMPGAPDAPSFFFFYLC